MRLPAAWSYRRLSEIAEIMHGFAFQSRYFSDVGEFILLTPGNFFEDGGFKVRGGLDRRYIGSIPEQYVLKRGDVIIAMTQQAPGLLGSAAVVPRDGLYLHNQRIGRIRILDKESVSLPFLALALNNSEVRRTIENGAGGTKVKHTSPAKIAAVRLPLPPIHEQNQIVRVGATWDRGIEEAERLLALKEQRKRALMQQLLTGKRRFPEFVRSKVKRDTRFGPRPADWPYPQIGDVAKEGGERNGEGDDIPVLSCTKHAGLVPSLEYFGKRVFSADTAPYKVVRRNQFAYATNHIEEGSIGLLNFLDAGLVSPMYTVFAVSDTVDTRFLYALFKTELYRHIFEVYTSSSVDRRGSLRWNEFKKIHIALPSIEEQRRIAAVLNTCDDELRHLREQVATLKQQKKGLMQKLLTGQVRVPVQHGVEA